MFRLLGLSFLGRVCAWCRLVGLLSHDYLIHVVVLPCTTSQSQSGLAPSGCWPPSAAAAAAVQLAARQLRPPRHCRLSVHFRLRCRCRCLLLGPRFDWVMSQHFLLISHLFLVNERYLYVSSALRTAASCFYVEHTNTPAQTTSSSFAITTG